MALAECGDPPPTIDHYTTVAALDKILETRFFLASDANATNDARELEHGRFIVSYIRTDYELHLPETTVLRRFIDFVRFQFLEQPVLPRHFIACFSSASDELLEQWRAYGDNCAGLILRLNTSAATEGTSDGARHPSLRRVIYEDGDQAAVVGRVLRVARDFVERWLPADAAVPDPLLTTAASLVCSHLAWQAVTFKMKWFRSEREWRFIESVYPGDEVEILSRGGRDFLPLYLGRKTLLPLRSVTLGPLVTETDEGHVLMALKKHGYADVPVNRSHIPYRKL